MNYKKYVLFHFKTAFSKMGKIFDAEHLYNRTLPSLPLISWWISLTWNMTRICNSFHLVFILIFKIQCELICLRYVQIFVLKGFKKIVFNLAIQHASHSRLFLRLLSFWDLFYVTCIWYQKMCSHLLFHKSFHK